MLVRPEPVGTSVGERQQPCLHTAGALARLVPLSFVDERLDPLAELERLIHSRTCEICDEVWSEALSRYWKCRTEQKGGYVSKHWRYWKLCPNCLCKLSGVGGFSELIFPVIANMRPADMVEQLIAVQLMQVPAAQVFYMDFVVEPEGVRLKRRV